MTKRISKSAKQRKPKVLKVTLATLLQFMQAMKAPTYEQHINILLDDPAKFVTKAKRLSRKRLGELQEFADALGGVVIVGEEPHVTISN